MGLADLVDAEQDMTVSGHAGNVDDILDAVAVTIPDVVVLDVRLADGNGIDVCRQIQTRYEDIACLFFTSHLDPDWNMALDAGAGGFLLKRLGGTELVDAIRALANGDQLPLPSWAVIQTGEA